MIRFHRGFFCWPVCGAGQAARLGLVVALACASATAQALPSFEAVQRNFQSSETLVLDRMGEPIHRLRTDSGARRGDWVALADISPALRTALVLSEDKRFYEHSGVDWQAVSAAAWANLWNRRTRGASTLTMQLAGLLDDDWRAPVGGRSVGQKLGQAAAAQWLEQRWSKSQILEAYLNLVAFRGELVGIDALSRSLFGKAPHGLLETEAAVAVALVRAPNARPPQVAQRACGVLRLMQPTAAAIDCANLAVWTEAALQRPAWVASEGIAPHFARRVLALPRAPAQPAMPQRVRTSLQAGLQRFALDMLQRQLRELRNRNVADGAVVVLDNASGEVLAWVGSSGELSAAAEVDGVTAPRQPGSTLKPFLYAQALAERRLTAASLLDDSPAQIGTASGLYIPQNYDRRFKGWVSVRTALASSLNVPAVRTLVMVSPDAFARQLRALGLPLKEAGDYYGYSLALGSAEVPLLALTNAYRALANGGRASAVRFFPAQAAAAGALPMPMPSGSSATTAPVIDPRAAFIVGDILADNNARAATFGADSLLATRMWTAVKTGTSKDMRDNWALGWSSRYTVGVWVGNAGGAPMHDVSGVSGAAPIWAAVMGYLHRQQAAPAPQPPQGLVRTRVAFDAPLARDGLGEASRDEWFVAGTEQPLFFAPAGRSPSMSAAKATAAVAKGDAAASREGLSAARIVSPAEGTVIALDPDIPPQRQRLHFEATELEGLSWRIDGKPLARGAKAQWLPWPGRHTVQLLDASGRVVDDIRVEVRGAGVRGRVTGPPAGSRR